MNSLQQLINKKLITREEIVTLLERHYLPHVKALSCTYDETKNELTLFTHAPADIDVIEFLAKQLNVPYDTTNAKTIAQSIHAINAAFYNQHIEKKTTNTLWGFDCKYFNLALFPIHHLIWNRDLNLKRPRLFNNITITYVHGHDTNEHVPLESHILNLDNWLGKAISLFKEVYHVFFNFETSCEYNSKISCINNKPNINPNTTEANKNSIAKEAINTLSTLVTYMGLKQSTTKAGINMNTLEEERLPDKKEMAHKKYKKKQMHRQIRAR